MIFIGAALAVMAMVQAFELVAVMTQFGAVFISSAFPINTKATDEPESAEVQVQTERREIKQVSVGQTFALAMGQRPIFVSTSAFLGCENAANAQRKNSA